MKRLRIILILFAILAISLVVFCLVQPSEPSYQGRKLSAWLNNCGPTASIGVQLMKTKPLESIQAAQNAVRAMGTNAIPTLLKWAQARDSSLRTRLNSILDHQRFITLRFRSAGEMRSMATIGFLFLGTNALSAVPELTRLAQSPDSEQQVVALHCLISIPTEKPDLFPLLLTLRHDPHKDIQALAGDYLQDYDNLTAGGSLIYQYLPQMTNSVQASPPMLTK